MTTSRHTNLLAAPPAGRTKTTAWPCRAFLIRAMLLSLLALAVMSHAVVAEQPQAKLSKLAPEPLVIHIENGSGFTDAVFALSTESGIPAYKVTEAAGNANSIPAGDIKFEWGNAAPPEQAGKRSLLTARISVDTKAFVEPGVNYKGRIIFSWQDSEQWIDFTVSDRSALDFEIATTRLDVVLGAGQPDKLFVRIKNNGKANIQRLTTSSSGLTDSETQHKVVIPAAPTDLGESPVRPGQEAEIAVTLPRPSLAGTYDGTLDIVANERLRKSIPVVLRTRGPVLERGLYFLPPLLFVLTLGLGFWLSNKLEDWFNLGGLQRAQLYISLQQAEKAIARTLEDLRGRETKWGARVFTQTGLWLQQNLDELRGLLAEAAAASKEKLTAEAERYAVVAEKGKVFRIAVERAGAQWPGEANKAKLLQTATLLDATTTDSDLDAYRKQLGSVLAAAAAEGEGGASVHVARESLPPIPTVEDLRRRIGRMAGLYRVTVWLVVFIFAYTIFYAKDFAFGSLLDYLGVFLWALGLTQTGTQIMARARSNRVPEH